jgi:hypothetical protein
MLEEHNETKAEAEKQAGIESATAAAEEPMDGKTREEKEGV